MGDIFLPGPLGAPEIVAALSAGAKAAAAPRAARLDGHSLRFDPDSLRFAVVPEAVGRVSGVLVPDGGRAGARAAFVLEAMGGQAVAVDVGTAAGTAPARAFLSAAAAAPARRWGEADWSASTARALAEAVPEILGQLGGATPGVAADLLGGIAMRARARVRGAATDTPVALRSGLAIGDVEPVSRGFGYAKFFAVEDLVLRHRRFDGRMSQPVGRAVFTSGDAVSVLPFDPVRGAVLLIEQFRAGAYARRDPHPWALETVAGRCDGMEPPEATARREAREEAGLELGRLERIAGYYPTPAIAAEFITSFVGEADLGAAGGVHGLASEDEDIRTLVVPLAQAFAAVGSGEVNNAPLVISLLWLERHHARLAAEWGGAA